LAKRNYDIECPVCDGRTVIEVLNSDDEPEHCPLCGAPIDLDEEYFDEE